MGYKGIGLHQTHQTNADRAADSDAPRISIITVCKDAQNTLTPTFESVRAQHYPNIEYIVVDGASTDGTCKVIEQFSDIIDTTLSEEDSGIFDAMNKGANLATGDFLLFLNAGDTLLRPETIEAVVGAIGRSDGADIYHGDIVIFDPDSGRSVYHAAKKASRVSLFRGAMSHQAMLIKKSAFEEVGQYDQSYLIGGDYEWSLRALHNTDLRFDVIKVCVSVFTLGGLSSAAQNQQIMRDEFDQVRRKYYSKIDTLKIRAVVRFHKIFGI